MHSRLGEYFLPQKNNKLPNFLPTKQMGRLLTHFRRAGVHKERMLGHTDGEQEVDCSGVVGCCKLGVRKGRLLSVLTSDPEISSALHFLGTLLMYWF